LPVSFRLDSSVLRKSKPECIKSWRLGRGLVIAVLAILVPVGTAAATPAPAKTVRLSADTLTTPVAQHATEVEPDSFSYGSTVVSAFQIGRFFEGASAAIGFATSHDAGATWQSGMLPQLTTSSAPAGTADRATDPAVAFDAAHGRWLVESLTLSRDSAAVVVSGSADGVTWDPPATAALRPLTSSGDTNLDKSWIACDNGPASPFRGRCYVAYTDFTSGTAIGVQSSSDGGLTWSAPVHVAVSDDVPGVQPVVRPNGELVLVYLNGPNWVQASRSTDGGASFGPEELISRARAHERRVQFDLLRFFALPSAEVDRAGRVWVAWPDCRFRRGCAANDIVVSHSTANGWSAAKVVRVPGTGAKADHVLPGLAVDPTTSGAHTRLALTFYTLRSASCAPDSCRLDVRMMTSSSAGARWSGATRLNAQAMHLDWLAQTNGGFMVGDYVSTSFARGRAVGVFALAAQPRGEVLNEAIHAVVRRVR
jgi:hypothetical protein